MADQQGQPSGGVLSSRLNDNFLTPPGTLGFSHLVTPDEYTPPGGSLQRNFKLAIHFTDDGFALMKDRLERWVEKTAWPAFIKDATKAGRPMWTYAVKEKGKPPRMVEEAWPMPSVEDFLDKITKYPKEGSRNMQSFLQVTKAAEYVAKKGPKAGQVVQRVMAATDLQGHPVDVAKAKLGMGSTIQSMLTVGIYSAPLTDMGKPAISLKLEGVRILKLVKFGGSGPALGDLTEEDRALLGEDSELDTDLSAYTRSADETQGASKGAAKESATGETYAEDLDDEIPF